MLRKLMRLKQINGFLIKKRMMRLKQKNGFLIKKRMPNIKVSELFCENFGTKYVIDI